MDVASAQVHLQSALQQWPTAQPNLHKGPLHAQAYLQTFSLTLAEIDDMNTMDVDTDTDYEPKHSTSPGASVGEPCHKHGLGDNKSIVDKSPVTIFDPQNDRANGRPQLGPEKRPGALKTNGSRQACTK